MAPGEIEIFCESLFLLQRHGSEQFFKAADRSLLVRQGFRVFER
jgi:hypothetical protein